MIESTDLHADLNVEISRSELMNVAGGTGSTLPVPFRPYPQVPLGWRQVSLEWDDGWWPLDFTR